MAPPPAATTTRRERRFRRNVLGATAAAGAVLCLALWRVRAALARRGHPLVAALDALLDQPVGADALAGVALVCLVVAHGWYVAAAATQKPGSSSLRDALGRLYAGASLTGLLVVLLFLLTRLAMAQEVRAFNPASAWFEPFARAPVGAYLLLALLAAWAATAIAACAARAQLGRRPSPAARRWARERRGATARLLLALHCGAFLACLLGLSLAHAQPY